MLSITNTVVQVVSWSYGLGESVSRSLSTVSSVQLIQDYLDTLSDFHRYSYLCGRSFCNFVLLSTFKCYSPLYIIFIIVPHGPYICFLNILATFNLKFFYFHSPKTTLVTSYGVVGSLG